MVGASDLQSRGRHGRHECVGRVLDDGGAAGAADGEQAGGAVVEHAAQDDADHARAVGPRRRAEQRIDRRAEAVFARATIELHHAA